MDKDKRNITSSALTESKHLFKLLDVSDAQEFKKMVPELQDTWVKKQMFRTETEMRVSVLNDARYGTKAAKYWQSVREQNSHFQSLMKLSFEYRKNDVEIEQLLEKIKKEKDPLEKDLLQVDVERKTFEKANMQLQARARMDEISLWSKLKKENDDGSFDTQNVNSHQMESYAHLFDQRRKTITSGTSQPEVFNVMGQYETIRRIAKERGLNYDGTPKKSISKKPETSKKT